MNWFSRQFYDFFCPISVRLHAFKPALMWAAQLCSFSTYPVFSSGLGPISHRWLRFGFLMQTGILFGRDSWRMVQVFRPHSQLIVWFWVQFSPWPPGGYWDVCSHGSHRTHRPRDQVALIPTWNCRVPSFDSFVFSESSLFLICDSLFLISKQYYVNFKISKDLSLNSMF